MAVSTDVKAGQIVERVAVALETMDRRLARMEDEIAAQAAMAESFVSNLEEITGGVKELREMFVRQGEGIERVEAMLSNYVEATQGLRRESIKLQSEVRERLKAV